MTCRGPLRRASHAIGAARPPGWIWPSLMLLMAAGGCSGEPPAANEIDVNYVVRCQSPGWETVVFLNDNPVQRMAGPAETRDVTVWVRQGANTVRFETQAIGPPAPGANVALLGLDAYEDFTETIAVLDDVPSDGAVHQKPAEFTGANAIAWRWEQADVLDGIDPQDRRDILTLVHRFVEALRSRDLGALVEIPVHYWTAAAAPEGLLPQTGWFGDRDRSQAEQVFAYDDYVVVAVPEEQIEWFVGRQSVMLTASVQRDEAGGPTLPPLVFAGHAPQPADDAATSQLAYRITQFHFIRLAGRWTMLTL